MIRVPPIQGCNRLAAQSTGTFQQLTLNWMCWDDSSVVASLAHEALRKWTAERGIHLQLRDTDWLPVGQQILGLSVRAAWELDELQALARSISKQREAQPTAIQLVYVGDSLLEQRSRLVQAGAQIVVNPLSILARTLTAIAERIPRCFHDSNLLTQGLMQPGASWRPWQMNQGSSQAVLGQLPWDPD